MTGSTMGRLALGFGLCCALAIAGRSSAEEPPFFEYAKIDPRKVVTAEKCGECHIQEAEVWKKTPHAESFQTLHRKAQAEEIAKKMGFRLIKRDSLCFSCHYTPVVQGDKIRVVSGVSCESCHGAGADYLEIHNVYGEGFDHASEPAAHRKERIEDSRRAGMRRPSDLYPVVANCFSCHTVPLERLVNEGGHTTGSANFELVEWTQGRIRHNFLESLQKGTQPVNRERPMARKRLMYVVGRALDLEYSVRGLAKAETDGIYSKAMSRRVRGAIAELRAIQRGVEIDAVADMLSAVKSVQMVPRNEGPLLAAADRVQKATRSFLAQAEPTRLAALDDLVRGVQPELDPPAAPGAEDAFELAAAGEAESGAAAGAAPARAAAASSPTAAGGQGSGGGASIGSSGSARSASESTGAVGAIRTRIRPASKHRTVGPASCSGCHNEQNQWWFGHQHSKSIEAFYDGKRENLQIARLYGIQPAQMTTGRALCMDCHGTIISGKESRDVLDGVGCESCHGAAGDWLEPHKNEADKELGRQRPGHLAALANGKRDLRQSALRAEVCTGCHYVTEPRLLSAGHPSGADFDYVRGMNEVRHWQARMPDSQIAAATGAVVASRGPVPKVRVASLGPGASGSSAETAAGTGASATTQARIATGRAANGSTGSSAAGSGRANVGRRGAEVYAIRPPAPRPVVFTQTEAGADTAGGDSGGVSLPAFPDLDGATIEDVLLAVKERLKILYRLVDPTNSTDSGAAGGRSGGSR